jgi:hypothetical protein
MQLLGFIYKPLDFSDEKINRLSGSIENLRQTLMYAGFTCYADQLQQIRQASERRDSQSFREQLNCRVLFGGFGAMWEIWISDQILMSRFEKQFREFLENLEGIGVRNNKIDQIKRVFIGPN